MRKVLNRGWGIAALSLLMSCAVPQFETVTIHESPDQFVKLYHVPVGDSGEQFNHPAIISREEMERILKGVRIQEYHGSIPLPFTNNLMKSKRHRAFSNAWVKYFAPKLARGLKQATPEEVVAFFETGQATSLQQMTTSGGMFIHGEALHIFLSNYHVLTDIGQDNEEYTAPFRLTPLVPIHPEPGKLEFEPSSYMVELDGTDYEQFLGKQILHLGIRFRELSQKETSSLSNSNP